MSDVWKKIFIGCIAVCLGLLAGYVTGRVTGAKKVQTRIVSQTDTVFVEVHDTSFVETRRTVIRRDTVMLASVDTLLEVDSVFVEVPIERRTFEGANYSITATGYNVGLSDVWLKYPVVSVPVQAKFRHWKAGVGVQVGYGLTAGGLSPYAGVGVMFGYWF